MMTEMKLPACYAVIDENEMTYLDGGATIADSDAYKAFLNVGQVFNQLARIFSGASSIINNIRFRCITRRQHQCVIDSDTVGTCDRRGRCVQPVSR